MLQKYRYLCALAKERHFARAAKACNVSQPTLSNGLRHLEERLNVKLIERGQKFIGLTSEGERVLEHAKRMLAEQELLLQSLCADPTDIQTQLKIGAIPTAIPFVSDFIDGVRSHFPNVRFLVETLTSKSIKQKLTDFDLDIGLSYVDGELGTGLQSCDLYHEKYFLVVHDTILEQKEGNISWQEAADLPLCLLTPDMQNRQIADTVFEDAGVSVEPIVESTSLINLYTNVKRGIGAAIMPHQFVEMVAQDDHIHALKLIDPTVSHKIGLLTRATEPSSFLVKEIFRLAENQYFKSKS